MTLGRDLRARPGCGTFCHVIATRGHDVRGPFADTGDGMLHLPDAAGPTTAERVSAALAAPQVRPVAASFVMAAGILLAVSGVIPVTAAGGTLPIFTVAAAGVAGGWIMRPRPGGVYRYAGPTGAGFTACSPSRLVRRGWTLRTIEPNSMPSVLFDSWMVDPSDPWPRQAGIGLVTGSADELDTLSEAAGRSSSILDDNRPRPVLRRVRP